MEEIYVVHKYDRENGKILEGILHEDRSHHGCANWIINKSAEDYECDDYYIILTIYEPIAPWRR